MPANLQPMLATLTPDAFDDPDWQFEIKWDGYRALAYTGIGTVQLRSRNNKSFNQKFAAIAQELQTWPVKAVFDGEIVVISSSGTSDFSALQQWHIKQEGRLVYYVFDLLWLEGADLRNEPLTKRRELLRKILPENGIIRYSDSIDTYGINFYRTAQQNGLEGIIAKQKSSPYLYGKRTSNWYKIKTELRQEAVICGYTKKKDSPRLISSLVLGLPDADGFKYIGLVGTGLPASLQQELFKKMNPLFTTVCPFLKKPATGAPTLWVKPKLVCEVKFTEQTPEGLLRHPSFVGLRIDKSVKDLNIETLPKSKSKLFQNPIPPSKTIPATSHIVPFTNLDKIYWPGEGITKKELIDYYESIAPVMLPYLKDRPQSLHRFPNGISGNSFFQKDSAGKIAPWLRTYVDVHSEKEKSIAYLVCDDVASLLYMANLGCIEINPWHSRTASPETPDWCVIDLDPGAISFDKVIETARVVHELLKNLGIPSFPKTSGATGLHIYIPLGARYSYDQSRQLCQLLATIVHNQIPKFTSLERNPKKRSDKIYLDFLQNRHSQTICAPYSVRPKPGATVSTPLHWTEVKKGLHPSKFNLKNIAARVRREGDLFSGVLENGIDLNAVLRALAEHLSNQKSITGKK